MNARALCCWAGAFLSAPAVCAAGYDSASFVAGVNGSKTGFFHVEKDAEGRHWVIDPLGRGYYPMGMAHCRIWQQGYDFKERNLKRCGSEEAWLEETLTRLKAWKFNFFDGWWPKDGLHKGLSHVIFPWMGQPFAFDKSDPERHLVLNGEGRTPGSCFPNVFHPEWRNYCRQTAQHSMAPQRYDPWVLGYYSDNELAWWGAWGDDPETGMYDAVKRLPPEHSGRKALEAFTAQHADEKDPRRLKLACLKLVAEKYFEGTVGAIREADPNHMVFGCRFAGYATLPDVVWETAGRYLDVVSFNCYAWADLDRNQVFDRARTHVPLAERLAHIHKVTGKPLILTEWSYVAVDSGVPCTWGDGQVFKTQTQRAQAAELYVRTVMAQPFVAGYCYFMWADQPPQGVSKTFLENSNFGLVNHDGVPYREMTEMFARVQADPLKGRKANVPAAHPNAPSCMPRTAEEFWARRSAKPSCGSRPQIDFKGDLAGIAFLRDNRAECVLRPLVQFAVDGTNTYMYSRKICGVKEKTTSFGAKAHEVVLEGAAMGRRHRTTLEVVPFEDRPQAIVSVVRVENVGEKPIELKELHVAPFPCFACKPLYDWGRQVKRLWGEPRRYGWVSPDGHRLVDVESCSFWQDGRSRFWQGSGGDVHPDVIFKPTHRVLLNPGDAWHPPAGQFYVVLSVTPEGRHAPPSQGCKVESERLVATFDPLTGSLVEVREKGAAKPILSANGGALWEGEFDGGLKLTERTLAKNGGRVDVTPKDGGLEIVWADTNVTLRLDARAVGEEIEMQMTVAKTARAMTHLFFPFNLTFDPRDARRVVVPGNPYRGFGLSLHPEFFMRQPNAKPDKTYLGIGDCYANCHSDFVFVEQKEGASLMFCGVQPRPEHEPWKCPNPFVRTGWVAHAVGGARPTGRIVHGVWPFVMTRETERRLPAVRFAAVRDLQAGLDGYAKANDLGKPLAKKVKPDVLKKMLDGPLLYLEGTAKEMISALPHIPAPSMIHTSDYVHGGFDHQYPDFLPCNPKWGTDADLAALIDACHARGMLFSPYTNPTWWCDEPRGPTFRAAGEAPLYVKGDGKHRFEDYGGAKGWTVTFWHPAVRAANRKTVRQFTRDFACDLLFQDQVGGRMETDDFNPVAPHPTAYTEGLLSMIDEDCRDAALGCEDGWDKVADVETAMFGNCWRMVPWSLSPPKHQTLYKSELPPHLWEYEAAFPRLMKGETLFYMHDLGQFVWDERILAWMVAFAINTSYRTSHRTFLADTPKARWYRRLCEVQKTVIAKLAAQPVVSFVHDRAPLLARTDLPHDSPLDDGAVIAQYGTTKVYVNLGNVPRKVGPYDLAPYGWKAEAAR